MPKSYKVVINGKVFLREYHELTGLYENELIGEKEQLERLLEDLVVTTIGHV